MKYALKIENLRKQYDGFTLNDIYLEIPAGKIVGLIGENGAGKTTLLSLLLGQVHKDAGTVQFFDGKDALSEREIKMQIGYVLDECCYHSKLKAKHISSVLKSIYDNWDDTEFRRLLTRFSVDYSMKIGEMSRGTKIKLMLAAALAHNPKLLILDECTSGLDPIVRDDVMEILKGFIKDKDNTVFFSTHITSDLEKIADDVAFLHHGNLIFYESVQTLMNRFCIVTCTKNSKFGIEESKGIRYALSREDGTVSLLVDRAGKYPEKGIVQESPSIDEIMAIMVKGVQRK